MSLGYTTKVANADCKVYVGNLGLDFIRSGECSILSWF